MICLSLLFRMSTSVPPRQNSASADTVSLFAAASRVRHQLLHHAAVAVTKFLTWNICSATWLHVLDPDGLLLYPVFALSPGELEGIPWLDEFAQFSKMDLTQSLFDAHLFPFCIRK